jgi:glucose-6-phosphate-specific signal transduction histidine kinase
MFSACFSLLPILSGFLMLTAFNRWDGNWAGLLASGNLLTASASLMASAVYVLHGTEKPTSFLNSASGLLAILVIAFSCLFYAAFVLVNQGIIPAPVRIVPKAIVLGSLVPYVTGLIVTYRCLVLQHKRLPSNQEVRDDQVDALENDVAKLSNE